MKQIIFSLVLLCGFLSCSYSSNKVHPSNGSWYVGNGFGASFFNITESTRVGTGSGWPDDLYTHHAPDASVLFSLAGGYTWIRHQTWLPFFSFGASLTHAFPAKVNGQILQFALPQFANYKFNYQIQSTTLLATAKGNIFRYGNLAPYLSAAVGSAFNRATAYNESTVSSNIMPRLSPGFQNKTNQQFSYLLGIGIDYLLQKNLWLGLGYQYSHFGKIEIGPGRGSFSAEKLNTTLTGNNAVFHIYYYFDQME